MRFVPTSHVWKEASKEYVVDSLGLTLDSEKSACDKTSKDTLNSTEGQKDNTESGAKCIHVLKENEKLRETTLRLEQKLQYYRKRAREENTAKRVSQVLQRNRRPPRAKNSHETQQNQP